jgi:hypothetical protein
MEVKSLNIKIINLEIGYIQTPMLAAFESYPCDIDDYAPVAERVARTLGSMEGNFPGDVTRCAEAVIKVEQTASPGLSIVPIGTDAVTTLRKYAEYIQTSCDKWGEVGNSIERDGPRQGFFAAVPHYVLFDY